MLINSVIIVLREVLEAALIVSVLLALCQLLNLSRRYFSMALVFCGILAVLYAVNISDISMLFDGVGQEVVNASLHVIVFVCLLVLMFSIGKPSYNRVTLWAIAGCFSAAFVREGSEIIIYIQGFMGIENLFESVLTGSFIGAGVGFSLGVFFYYVIVSFSVLNGLRLSLLVLILISGGMITQALQLLTQADIIASQAPLWNSSEWVSEGSVVGQVLYALVGYESTPSPIQVICYAATLFVSSVLAFYALRAYKKEM